MRDEKIELIRQMAHRMRRNVFEMALAVGGNSHIGGGLSIVDITATLYGAILKLDAQNPDWPERDRFILSKGHGVLGYYTALQERGFITTDELMHFEKQGSDLLGHPVKNRPKGIEFSNGSLGMGLSLGIGVALAAKRRNQSFRVFVLMGDGECNEGSVWEASMAAAHFKLDNMVAIIDRNQLQQTGANKDIMSVGNIAEKWKAFGWNVKEVNGHDHGELYDVFSASPVQGQPTAVVAHTVKGKGLAVAENNNEWHHFALTQAAYQMAVQDQIAVQEADRGEVTL